MKPIMSTRYLILFMIALFAGNAQAQSIRVERVDGQLRVNGEPVDADVLHEELDLGEVEFRLQSSGIYPMRIEINGKLFEIWQDRVAKATLSGPFHFKLSIGPDGKYTSIESGAPGLPGVPFIPRVSFMPGVIDAPEAPDMPSLLEMVFKQVAGITAVELDPHQMMEIATVAAESRDSTVPQQLEEMASRLHEAKNMLELSSYLENVQNASDELYELLQHEWRKEVEVSRMAGRIRALDDGVERDEAIEELRTTLEEIFLMKQENRRMEIQHLEMELERMERRLKERSRAMDRLIDARLDELLGSGQ